ncbi:hypothetical protein H6G06_20415 [Anabaena sphaerica FACHB-251]|uniref:Uncharacterized protein n=1 Tax=Anabaena sphaerica FACHB-251 TaxID=2692883 RepID=A0A926WJR1_9NOST|nr:hypothetical protein [Anabaena sphaerica]MBD2295773.1 hypothetical protein [Anabaena sphaerica FACHB-251]
MNIADTSNNGTVIEPLNFANSPQSEQANCPFYSVLHDENMSVTNLPLLNPAADVYDGLHLQQCESAVVDNVDNSKENTQKDWIAEPDSEKQALVDSEFQKLLTLNEDLQTANSDLYAQVEQLKQELAEAEKILQWQKKRSSVTDSMLNQQTQELAAAQDQIQSLFQQLETAVQTVQSQEMFIETHKSQLQLSQQRIAQLERECTLLQTNYGEQSQQLLQSENTCRELRTRLIRQQRQTLQFKAALEKCLDTPVPNYDTLEDSAYHPHDVTGGHTRFSRKARSLFPHAQPIKPWSAEADSLSDICSDLRQHVDNSWLEPSTPCADTKIYSTPISEPAENSSDVNDTETPTQSSPSLEVDESADGVGNVSYPGSSNSNLDRQLENLIEMFFASQVAPSTPPAVNDTKTNPADGLMWETLASNLEENETLETVIEQQLGSESNPPNPSCVFRTAEFTLSSSNESPINASLSSPEKDLNTAETGDYWSELPIDHFTPEPLGEYQLDQKSPSPLIYPQRPPKGRKSLASVELPNFRTKGNQSKVNGEESK